MSEQKSNPPTPEEIEKWRSWNEDLPVMEMSKQEMVRLLAATEERNALEKWLHKMSMFLTFTCGISGSPSPLGTADDIMAGIEAILNRTESAESEVANLKHKLAEAEHDADEERQFLVSIEDALELEHQHSIGSGILGGIGLLKSKVAALKAENARIQTESRNWKTAAEANRDAAMGYQDQSLQLKQENARLREALQNISTGFKRTLPAARFIQQAVLMDESALNGGPKASARAEALKQFIAEIESISNYSELPVIPALKAAVAKYREACR